MKRSRIRSMVILLIFAIAISFLASCKTAPKKPEKPIQQAVTEEEAKKAKEAEREKEKNLLFERAIGALEEGTPEKLAEAVRIVRENKLADTSEGKEIIFLSKSIFDLLYSLSKDKKYIDFFSALDISTYSGRYLKPVRALLSGNYPDGGWEKADERDFFGNLLAAISILGRAGDKTEREKIFKYLDRAIAVSEKSILPYYVEALAYQKEGMGKREIRSLEKVLQLYGDFFPGRLLLAEALLENNPSPRDSQRVITLLEGLEKKMKFDANTYYLLARAYYNTAKLESASVQIAKGLILAPANINLLLLRAHILEREEKWDRALRTYKLILKQAPEERDALLGLARVTYFGNHNLKGAIGILTEAEKKYSDDADFPELRGRILMEESRDNEGLKALNRALEIEPNRISALRLLLENAVKMKRWIQGSIYLSRILKSSQGSLDEEDYLLAYEIYTNINDSDSALEYAEKLYKLGTRDIYSYYYARALIAAGKKERALAVIEKGINKARTSGNGEIMSRLYYLKGKIVMENDPEAALNLFRHSIFEYPENVDTMIELARMYIRNNDFRRASLYLRQAVKLRPEDQGLKIQLEQVENQLH